MPKSEYARSQYEEDSDVDLSDVSLTSPGDFVSEMACRRESRTGR